MTTPSRHVRRRLNPRYTKRIRALLKHPFFWILTVSGNSLIVIGSLLIHFTEKSAQSQPFEYIDSLLWSTSLVTTIGYGNHVPLTFYGKMSVLVLMLLGTLFIWSYMAFVVTAIITPELSSLEKDLSEVERELLILKKIEEAKK